MPDNIRTASSAAWTCRVPNDGCLDLTLPVRRDRYASFLVAMVVFRIVSLEDHDAKSGPFHVLRELASCPSRISCSSGHTNQIPRLFNREQYFKDEFARASRSRNAIADRVRLPGPGAATAEKGQGSRRYRGTATVDSFRMVDPIGEAKKRSLARSRLHLPLTQMHHPQ